MEALTLMCISKYPTLQWLTIISETYIDTCREIVGHILKSHRKYSVRIQIQKS